MEKTDILSMTLPELVDTLAGLGAEKYRASQVFSWLHKKNAASFEEMTDLPKEFRLRLSERFALYEPEISDVKISHDNTQKYLFVLPNNTIIESVLMSYGHGLSVCVSSQAGCKMGCAFCASAGCVFQRDLTAGEMLSQVYAIEKRSGEKIGRVVIMGTGEPFDNYDNTMRFIEILNSEKGRNLGARNITVSTCGIVPKIYELADNGLQINLAVSLHAPNGTIRAKFMPIEKKYPFDSLMEACMYYTEKTRRRITFEYALIDGENDGRAHAEEFAVRLKGMLCHVNLIPVNEVPGTGVKASGRTEGFARALEKAGINATVRRRLGSDINGACGQLRSDYLRHKNGVCGGSVAIIRHNK